MDGYERFGRKRSGCVRVGVVVLLSSSLFMADCSFSHPNSIMAVHFTSNHRLKRMIDDMLAGSTSVPASIDTVLLRVYLYGGVLTSVELPILTTYSEQRR